MFEEQRRHSNLSDLEKNCNQIFAKTPAITKELWDRLNNDVVPSKTDLFGYQMNTRQLIVLTGLIVLFTVSSMGTAAMWFTDAFQKRVESKMVLSEESPGYDLWRAPSPRPRVKIFIFNYTNVADFESGLADKLRVDEVGPYVYREQLERVNVRFSKVDGTVTYQEKRTYRFSPELSGGSEGDSVVVPNVPLLAGAAVVKNFNFLMRLSYNALLRTLSEKPFAALSVRDFVNGYENHLYGLSKSYLKFEDKRVFDNFGLLMWKQGTQADVYTVNTGLRDINKLGRVEKFNGMDRYEDMWGSEGCNRIQASDGLLYPADSVRSKKDVEFFMPQMCRKLPLRFAEETSMLDNKIPAFRYKFPQDLFDTRDNHENRCYCDVAHGTCPPKGFFNASICSFGAPLFYSWPHLHGTDQSARAAVSGLNPHPVVNDTFLDLHPKFGTLMRAKIKLQANVRVERSFGVSELGPLADGLMLPLVWFEDELLDEDLPDDLRNLIYQLTFTVRNVELGLKYGCLLATMVTLTCILLVLKKRQVARATGNSARYGVVD